MVLVDAVLTLCERLGVTKHLLDVLCVCDGVTVVLECCYSGVTVLLQQCYNSVRGMAEHLLDVLYMLQ
jgi:hypothetical protein